MAPAAAPPSPLEVHRKLSLHSTRGLKASRSSLTCASHVAEVVLTNNRVSIQPSNASAQPVSGTESDSDSILTPDVLSLSPGLTATHTVTAGIIGGAPIQQPLSSIAERRDGSGGEDSEDEEDEEEGGWKTANGSPSPQGSVDEGVLKAGYLWKKGERRKTWKKRWFVLRPAHLAYYKTAAEYQLLRLLELSDVHSCTKVALKRHDNTFGLVSPVRTFYLQAKTSGEVQEWVAAIDEARRNLQATSAQKHSSNPIPIPNAGRSAHAPPPITPSPPSFASYAQTITSSDSEDAAPSGQRSGQRTYSSSSQPGIAISSSPSHAAAVKDPAKTVLSGYLMKCGSKRKNWRKRWFVLTGEKLVYSASHMDTKPHRQFAFSEILDALEYDLSAHRQHPPPTPSTTVPTSSDPDVGHDDHTFKIVTTKRTLLLCAPGEEDEIKWLGAVRALIARRTDAGVVPGQAGRNAASNTAASPSGAASASDVSPPSSGFTSGASGGLKSKVRRLSASGGSGLSGVIIEERANEKEA